ncbi:MAG TPA: hypothetical protein VFE58_19900 [Tepidisphaeraceae bacterium]|jgi:hypothetical protein|nr:hypothetical protein [Tepidisphaeraceae bacterium]
MPKAQIDRKRRGRQPLRNVDPLLQIRRRLKALLSSLGALAAFERMPAEIRNQFFDARWPDPALEFDPSFPFVEVHGGAYAEIRRTVQEGFKRAAIDVGAFTLSIRDYYALAIPLRNCVAQNRKRVPLGDDKKFPASVTAFLELVGPALDAIGSDAFRDATFSALHREVLVPLVARSRLDAKLLHGRLSSPRGPRGWPRVTMTLYAEQPPMKYVRLEKGSRPMHRVGTPNTWNGIDYVSWTPESLGPRWATELGFMPGETRPVYIQSHALEQLRSRLDVYRYADWAQHWMYESLKKPTIVEKLPDGGLLVAMAIADQRVGYLVVTPMRDLVAVRTFLFLTMSRTPEGKMLERRLKLTRDEIDYLRLHELSRYTRTDLKDDAALRKLLSECGCGPLFALAEEDRLADAELRPTPFAADLKRYVGIAA